MAKNVEIELKLLARKAEAMSGLEDALREVCKDVKRLGRQRIRDSYLDTDDWRLYRAGYACRVRRTGGRAFLALKSLTRPRVMVSVREELEEPLKSPLWRSSHPVPGKRVGAKVRAIVRVARLRRLFRVHNARTTYEVRFCRRLLAHVSADDFVLLANRSERRLAEVEIEIVKGGQSELRTLARILIHRLGLSPAHRAKFQQGLAVAGLNPSEKIKMTKGRT